MKRYYITDRKTCHGDLLDCIESNARQGVEWIQIREKDLPVDDLLELTMEAVMRVAAFPAQVLVNAQIDVALAAGAHGIHLPSDGPSVVEVRQRVRTPDSFTIAVSTHTLEQVRKAEREGANLVVFGPVFLTSSKPHWQDIPGLKGLREACQAVSVPIAALGGVTMEREELCAEAGAAAIAGIRMFQPSGVQAESKK